jgi:hypothetical protein
MVHTWTDNPHDVLATVKSMVERAKETWYRWIPGWLPVCGAICGAALWIGQYTQSINDRVGALERNNDRINALEKQVQELQQVIGGGYDKTRTRTEYQRYDEPKRPSQEAFETIH